MKLYCKTCGCEAGTPHNLEIHNSMHYNALEEPYTITLEEAVKWCEDTKSDFEVYVHELTGWTAKVETFNNDLTPLKTIISDGYSPSLALIRAVTECMKLNEFKK